MQKPTVASLVWDMPSEIHQLQGDVVEKLGFPHYFFLYNEPIPQEARIVLVQGPYGPLLPLIRQLRERPLRDRPILAYWFQQSLDMQIPNWLQNYLVQLFSDAYRNYHEYGMMGALLEHCAPQFAGKRGRRLGFAGDIIWLHRHGLLDAFAVSSDLYQRYFLNRDIESLLLPRGYHPAYGSLLNLKRDIAVVWMGKTRNRRRARAVYWLREQLQKRGQVMQIYDGKENDFIFGEQRTRILNRAWFVLNVFPHPTWELSIRYYIAAANGAVVLTEPGKNKYAFVPGKHLVECPIEKMPDTIMYYLAHQEEWRAISHNMLSFMKMDLTLQQSIATILTQAEQIHNRRH